MLSKEEYKVLKERDMQRAVEIAEKIKADPDPLVKYRDSRPITDIKHMIETSASDEWYGDHVAFYQKEKKGGDYKKITYKETKIGRASCRERV